MQLLIFILSLSTEKVAVKITHASLDSLNIIPFQKYIVKRFFQKIKIFSNFFNFFYFFQKSYFLFVRALPTRILYNICRARAVCSLKNRRKP